MVIWAELSDIILCLYRLFPYNSKDASSVLVSKLNNKPVIVENSHLLSSHSVNIVVEAASQNAVRDDGLSILQNKRDFMIMSVGALLDESIYDIDRLHIVTHGVDETDGKDNWGWRKSSMDLVKRARKMIDEKNPRCELAIDGGLRYDNMDLLVSCNPDVVILSSAIFRDPDGIEAGVAKCRKALDESAAKYNL